MTIRMLISRILVPRGIRTGTTISWLDEGAGVASTKRSGAGEAGRIFSAGKATSLPYAGSVAPPFQAGAGVGAGAGTRAGSGAEGAEGGGKRLGRAPAVAVAAATGIGEGAGIGVGVECEGAGEAEAAERLPPV